MACFVCLGFAAADEVWFPGNFEAAMAQAQQQGKPLLLFFSANYCSPCKHVKRQFEDPALSEFVRGHVIALYFITDTEGEAAAIAA